MGSDDVKVDVSAQTTTPEVAPQRPYSIIFVGDLGSGGRLAGLTPIDKQDFAAVLSRARPALPLAVKDPFGGAEWEFQFCAETMKAFDPVGLLAQVPAARWRLGIREKILARRAAQISADELKNALTAAAEADATLSWLTQAAPAPSGAEAPATPTPAPGGDVLDMVDDPDQQARVAADVQKLVADAGGASRIPAGEAGRLGQILARIDRELAAAADVVIKHPDFRRLETAWRSVRFIVDRADFRGGVRLALIDAPREQAVERLIEHAINPAFEGEIPTPGLIVFDFAMSNVPVDYETLDNLAQHAASLPAPVTYPVDTQFFNIKSLRLLKNLPNLSGLIGGWEFAKWRTLRDQPHARVLAPVLGRFVLRAPHAPRDGAAEFSFAEPVATLNDIVWAGGHIAVAVCAARAYEKHGWPTRMWGVESGKIEDLPVIDNPNDPQNPWGPGDLLLPDARIDEPNAIGLNVLQAIKNKDYCVLLGGVSARRPVVTQEVAAQDAMLEVSVPYQQFSNIVSAWLCEQLPKLRGLPADEVQQKLLFGLAAMLRVQPQDDPEAIQVGVGAHPEDASRTMVQIRVVPPSRIAPGGMHIDFGFAV